MSHFTKIKTNITDYNALIKTIGQLGFSYKSLDSDIEDLSAYNKMDRKVIAVYKVSDSSNIPAFNFVWNSQEYVLVADVQLWKLNIDFNCFLDRLFQQYAYNVIMHTSSISGFHQIKENICYDGSIKITLQKWSSN